MMKYLKIVLPVLILVATFIVAGLMTGAPPTAAQIETTPPIHRVEVMAVALHEVSLDVTAYGTLNLREAVDVTASVGGPVVRVSPRLEPGEIVRRGQTLARLDPTDFEMAKARAEAAIADAELRLVQEEAEAHISIEEWTGEGEPGPLVSREPQLKQARANLAAVRSELKQAEKNLERCVIRAPFDALVRDRGLGKGQFIQPGQVLATIQEVSFAEAHVPLTEAQLAALGPEILRPRRPADSSDSVLAPALIESRIAGEKNRRLGRVTRTEGVLDAASRMLTLVVRVDDPLALDGDASPLIPGQFVDVRIRGRQSLQAALIPRSALLAGEKVLVVQDGIQAVRSIELAQIRGETAVISSGLAAGDLVQTAPALGAQEGIAVEITEVEAPSREDLGLLDFDSLSSL